MAISHLVGTARDWAFTCIHQARASGTVAFPSWEAFKLRLEANFHGDHVRHNDRAKFLRARQKKKTVFEFVQTLRQLSAAVIGEPLDETTKITILREGLNVGPARTQLFRDSPETFEDACQIALNEDASQRRAHNTRVGPDSSTTHGPTPMDLSSTDLTRQRQLSNVRCFKCNLRGHYSRDCRRRRSNSNRQSHPERGQRPPTSRRVRFRFDPNRRRTNNSHQENARAH